jgi:hypothetical protein
MARKIRKTLKSGGRKLNKKKINKRSRKKQKGGIKIAPDGIGITVSWKGIDRNLYTYEREKFSNDYIELQSQSQGTEGSTITKSGREIITLKEFGVDNTFETLKKNLKERVLYIFVIVFEKTKDEHTWHAKMYLGDQSYNHDELSDDVDAKNLILAAGELMMVLDENENGKNKLIINNQSGHYRPYMGDVEGVTTDFFGKKINIEFSSIDEMRSQSVSPLSSQEYGGKRSRKNKKSRKVKIIRR